MASQGTSSAIVPSCFLSTSLPAAHSLTPPSGGFPCHLGAWAHHHPWHHPWPWPWVCKPGSQHEEGLPCFRSVATLQLFFAALQGLGQKKHHTRLLQLLLLKCFMADVYPDTIVLMPLLVSIQTQSWQMSTRHHSSDATAGVYPDTELEDAPIVRIPPAVNIQTQSWQMSIQTP